MLRKIGLVVAIVAVCSLTAAVAGEKVTLEGKIACAKCTLGFEGAGECQNVLVVQSKKDAEPSYFYLVENEVAKEFGHACGGSKGAIVTGTVEDKDGKQWLTPSEIKAPEKA